MKLFAYSVCVLLSIFACRVSFGQLCLPKVEGSDLTSHCDYCQCAQGISPLETGSSGIRFDVRSLYRGAAYDGSVKQPNPSGSHESYLTNQLIVNYQIAESPFTVSAG